MKKWRANNMKVSADLKQIDRELDWFANLSPFTKKFYDPEGKKEAKVQERRKAVSFSRLTRKEARTHFSSEVATPSQTLYTLLLVGGYKVPEEFYNAAMSYFDAKQKNDIARFAGQAAH